jgi:hypothetical protein
MTSRLRVAYVHTAAATYCGIEYSLFDKSALHEIDYLGAS